MPGAFELLDETLRDGLQSPSVSNPTLEEKCQLLELMESVGIRGVDLGMPGAGPQAAADVLQLARYMRYRGLKLEPICAARTVTADIEAVVEASQRSGLPVGIYLFIGASSIRLWAEGWDLDLVLRKSTSAIECAVREGLQVTFVTEDTIRSSPQTLEPLFRNAIERGARSIVLCDTVGHATPQGTQALVHWTQRLIRQTGEPVEIEWHGHNDRGLAVPNALAALDAGARRIHGCGLGIGERVGNTSMELLLLTLHKRGLMDFNLGTLRHYVETVSAACRFPIPRNHPLFQSRPSKEVVP